jgi:hypothetical protein
MRASALSAAECISSLDMTKEFLAAAVPEGLIPGAANYAETIIKYRRFCVWAV